MRFLSRYRYWACRIQKRIIVSGTKKSEEERKILFALLFGALAGHTTDYD